MKSVWEGYRKDRAFLGYVASIAFGIMGVFSGSILGFIVFGIGALGFLIGAIQYSRG